MGKSKELISRRYVTRIAARMESLLRLDRFPYNFRLMDESLFDASRFILLCVVQRKRKRRKKVVKEKEERREKVERELIGMRLIHPPRKEKIGITFHTL